MKKKEQIFTTGGVTLRRKHISQTETFFGFAYMLLLLLVVVLLMAQRENYDPAERDLDMATLANDAPSLELFKPPLKRIGFLNDESSDKAIRRQLVGIMPESILDHDWQIDTPYRKYDQKTVYEKINGAAEQYIKFGFRALHYISIKPKDETFQDIYLAIEIYDMANMENALGIYNEQRQIGISSQSHQHLSYYETPIGHIGIANAMYFKISASKTEPGLLEKSRQIMQALAEAFPVDVGSRPLGIAIFHDALRMPLDSITFAKQNIFQYSFTHDFWLAYINKGEEHYLFLHQAPSTQMAKQMFDNIIKENKAEYQAIKHSKNRQLFKHQYLDSYFALGLTGEMVYGLDGGKSSEQTNEKVDALQKTLERINGQTKL